MVRSPLPYLACCSFVYFACCSVDAVGAVAVERNHPANVSQVLAQDLLNPAPAAEARQHKLKVRLFPRREFSSWINRNLTRISPTDFGPCPEVVLYGCEVRRVLRYYHRLLSRPNRRCLQLLFNHSLPADWWKSKAHGGKFLPTQVNGGQRGRKMLVGSCFA